MLVPLADGMTPDFRDIDGDSALIRRRVGCVATNAQQDRTLDQECARQFHSTFASDVHLSLVLAHLAPGVA